MSKKEHDNTLIVRRKQRTPKSKILELLQSNTHCQNREASEKESISIGKPESNVYYNTKINLQIKVKWCCKSLEKRGSFKFEVN
jgi:hypothetical protein